MKRSEINRVVRRMERLAAEHGFCLPPFCGWTPENWAGRGPAYDETRDNLLGWDITDYGTGGLPQNGLYPHHAAKRQCEGAGPVSQALRGEAADTGGGPVLPHALPLEQNGGHYQPGRRLHPDQGLLLHDGGGLWRADV